MIKAQNATVIRSILADVSGVMTVKAEDSVDGEIHVSITGAFLPFRADGMYSYDKVYHVNIRQSDSPMIFKMLKRISLLIKDEDFEKRTELIDKYNKEVLSEVNRLSEACNLYFVHHMKDRKPVINRYGKKNTLLAGQPIVSEKVVDYWMKTETSDTPDERLKSKLLQIGNAGMFVAAQHESMIEDEVKSEHVKVMMRKAVAKAKAEAVEEEEVVETVITDPPVKTDKDGKPIPPKKEKE